MKSVRRVMVVLAGYLQEAGFAGGEEMFREFGDWLVATRGVEHAGDLDVQFLSEVVSQFFSEQGESFTHIGFAFCLDIRPFELIEGRLLRDMPFGAGGELDRPHNDRRCRVLIGGGTHGWECFPD